MVCYLASRLVIEHFPVGRHTTLRLLLWHVARYLPGGEVSDCGEIQNAGLFSGEWQLVVVTTDIALCCDRHPAVGRWVSKAAISSEL